MVAETEQVPGIREAITEAVSQSDFVAELEGEADELEGEITPETELASGETPPGTGDGSEGTEEASEAQEGTDEPPMVYWGTSLEGLSAEQRKEVIAALEQRDSTIQKLQQKLAEEPPAPEATEEESDPVDITDEDILRALGIDPEGDAFEVEQAKRHTLPLARQIMALEETVERIAESETVRETASVWNSELDRLEAEYGKLPGDRLNVLQYAAKENIANPEVLYFRLTAPARKAVDDQVARVRAKKAEGGGLRPRSTIAGKQEFEPAETLRDTVKKAALEAQRETGKKWSSILRQQ